MDMKWTKNLSKPFKYKENMNGKIEVVYLYTYIAVGKHIDGHWRLYGMFHNNQGKRPDVVPAYYKCWNMVPTENCLCHNGYSDYKIKGKNLYYVRIVRWHIGFNHYRMVFCAIIQIESIKQMKPIENCNIPSSICTI